MITWGVRPQAGNRYLSLGAIASGDVHVQARFAGPNGVSLHPLQRSGAVAYDSHTYLPRMGAYAPPGLGDSVYAAGHSNLSLPPVVPLAGSPRDPAYQV